VAEQLFASGYEPEGDAVMSATFSGDNRYRYTLMRRWAERGASGDGALWVMLNPSTAGAAEDDPTIRRCIGFSKGFGFRSLTVVNLFAFRATRPRDLWAQEDPVGPDNDPTIALAAREAQTIILAWGASLNATERGRAVVDILRANAFYTQRLVCLGRTKQGGPRHPLYVKSDTKLETFHG
jgi:hypothetical protein